MNMPIKIKRPKVDRVNPAEVAKALGAEPATVTITLPLADAIWLQELLLWAPMSDACPRGVRNRCLDAVKANHPSCLPLLESYHKVMRGERPAYRW